MTPSESSAILNAIDTLRTDVRGDIKDMRDEIAAMSKEHQEFRIKQAERNAEFASRERAESIGTQIHDEVNRGIVREGKLSTLRIDFDEAVRDVTDLTAAVAALQSTTLPEDVRQWAVQGHANHAKRTELSDHVIRQVAGYVALVIAGVVLAALGFTAAGAHVLHGLGG